jgi:hypothetical protein
MRQPEQSFRSLIAAQGTILADHAEIAAESPNGPRITMWTGREMSETDVTRSVIFPERDSSRRPSIKNVPVWKRIIAIWPYVLVLFSVVGFLYLYLSSSR